MLPAGKKILEESAVDPLTLSTHTGKLVIRRAEGVGRKAG